LDFCGSLREISGGIIGGVRTVFGSEGGGCPRPLGLERAPDFGLVVGSAIRCDGSGGSHSEGMRLGGWVRSKPDRRGGAVDSAGFGGPDLGAMGNFWRGYSCRWKFPERWGERDVE